MVAKLDTSSWEKQLAEMKDAEGGGIFFFIKPGRTRLRLVPEQGTENDAMPSFWIDTVGNYQGKPNKRRILLGIVAGADGREIPDEDKNKVVPLLVAPSVVTQIIELLAGGHDLFGKISGHAIAINRSGTGLGTDYAVQNSPDPVPLPDVIQYCEMSLSKLDEHYREQGTKTTTPVAAPVAETTKAQEEVKDPNDW